MDSVHGLWCKASKTFSHRVQNMSRTSEVPVDDADCGAPRDKYEVLLKSPGHLAVLHRGDFQPMSDTSQPAYFTLRRETDAPKVAFQLCIIQAPAGEVLLEQPMQKASMLKYNTPQAAVYWATVLNGAVYELRFTFVASQKGVGADAKSIPAAAVMQACVRQYNLCIYALHTGNVEGLNDDGDEDDVSWATLQYTAEVGPAPGEDDEPAFEFDATAPAQESPSRRSACGPRADNRCFADSVCFNRAIVLQDGGVVQAHQYDERGFVASGAPPEFTLAGVTRPKDAVLMNGETSLAMLDTDQPGRALQVDVARGEVVATYEPGLEAGIANLSLMGKRATDNPSLLACTNRNMAFAIDLRLPSHSCAVVEDGSNLTAYSHTLRPGQSFTCHATSSQGHLAVGDLMGQIRLFSGPPGSRKATGRGHNPKTAKSLLNASPSNPILHLDITSDGTYVLATCQHFLLVLCTAYRDDAGATKSGFATRMGKNKPAPLRLDLPPTVVAAMPRDWSFSKATFECNDAGEHWISGAAGSYIATWSMVSVRKALAQHRRVECEAKDEGAAIRHVHMAGGDRGEAVMFMTARDVGMEVRPRAGKTYVRNP